MSDDDIWKCPRGGCRGDVEIRCVRAGDGERKEQWEVRCERCHGYTAVYESDGDPYTQGLRIWEEMRREMKDTGE